MKRLNIKFLAILAVLFVGGSVGTVLLHGYQMQKTARTRLENANKARDEGDLVREYKQLVRYLQHRSDDTETYKRYLVVLKEALFTGQVTKNVMTELTYLQNGLEKAIRNNPNDIELRQLSTEFWLAVRREKDAIEHLEHLQGMPQPEGENYDPYFGALRPVDAQRLAAIRILMTRDRDALEILGKMLDFDQTTTQFGDDENPYGKSELNAYSLLADYYRKQMQASDTFEIPNRIMEKMVERNSDNATAHLMLATHRKRVAKGAQRAGLEEIDKALSLDSEDAKVLDLAGSFYADAGEFEKAAGFMEQGMQLHPDDVRFYRSRARLYRNQKNPSAAIEVLNKAINAEGKLNLNDELLHDRALTYLEMNDVDEAKRSYDLLIQHRKRLRPELVDILRGRIMLAEGKYLEAAELIAKVRPKLKDFNKDYQQQIARLLASAYQRGGQPHKATVVAQEDGMQSDNELSVKLKQAEDLVQRSEFNQALSIYADLQREYDQFQDGGAKRPEFLKSLLRVHMQMQKERPQDKKDWRAVDGLANAYMAAANMDRTDRELFTIQLLFEQGKRREARTRAQDARNMQPKNPNFWATEIGLTRDHEQALTIIGLMEKHTGDIVFIRSARGERIAKINPPDAIQQLEALLVGIEKFEPNQQADLKRTVANQLALVGGFDSAFAILEELLAEGRNAVPLITNIFELALKSGNEAKMDAMLEQFRKVTGPDSAEYLVYGARKTIWKIKNGGDASAIQSVYTRLDTAAARQTGWHMVAGTRADALKTEGKIKPAIEAYELAYSESPHPEYAQELVQLYIMTNDLAASRRYLAKLPEDARTSANVRNEILIQTRDANAQVRAKALERAKALVGPNSTNAEDLMFLAQVYQLVGDGKNALANYKQATEVLPNDSKTWFRYVKALVTNQQTARVEEAVKQIQLTSLEPSEMQLLLGQCYTVLKRPDEAKRHYREASRLSPENTVVMRNIIQLANSDGDTATMTEYLNKLVGLDAQSGVDKGNVRWARQVKASQLAESKTYPDFQKAVSLIEGNRDSFGKLSAQDLIVWLQLHADRPEVDSRRKANAKLQEIQKDRPLNIEERFIQARLLKAGGQWSEARSAMSALIADNPNNPALIVNFVEWLIEHGERDSLVQAGQLLRRLPAGQNDSLRLNCIVLVKLGNSNDAYRKLMALVPKNMPKENSRAIREVARMMDLLGEFDKTFYGSANKQWRRYLSTLDAEQRAAEFPMYVQFLMGRPNGADNKSLTSAFGQCNTAANREIASENWARVLQYVTLAIGGIRDNKTNIAADSNFYKATQKWLDAVDAAKFSPQDTLIQQAFLSDLRQDYDRVEAAYREYLALPDAGEYNKGVVRNNLAYHLATTGKGKEALEVINEAITSLGTRNDLRDTRAMAYIDLQRYSDAINDLNAIESDGEASPATYFHRAIAKMRDSDRAGATVDMNRAIELGLKKSELTISEAKFYDNVISTLGITDLASEAR